MRTTAKTARVARRALSALIILPALAGCAFHKSTEANRGNRAPITAVEIDSVHALNAYDAVHRLRPQILVYRGPVSLDPRQPPATPNVYVDNMLYGDVSTLRNIAAATIDTIKFYSAAEAQYAFGRGNAAGVIGIITKR
jgi:hypothetical protein